MSWLTKREALIQWLEPEAAQTGSSGGEDLSKAEGDGLKKLATDSTERAVFFGRCSGPFTCGKAVRVPAVKKHRAREA